MSMCYMHFYSCIKVNYIYICTFIGSLLSEDSNIIVTDVKQSYSVSVSLYRNRSEKMSSVTLSCRHFGFLFLSYFDMVSGYLCPTALLNLRIVGVLCSENFH